MLQKEPIPQEECQTHAKEKFEDRPMSPDTGDDPALLLAYQRLVPCQDRLFILPYRGKPRI